jgi:cell division protein FtsI (penicillin-binding protein 3)
MVIGKLRRDPARTPQKKRALLLLAGISLWSALLVGRLVQLQVHQHDSHLARAIRNTQIFLELSGLRGDLYARGGELLATSIELPSVYAQRDQIADPAAVARLLAPALQMSESELRRRLTGETFSYLRRKVDPAVAAAVRDVVRQHDLAGVNFLTEPKRFYPHRVLAAQLVGAVDMENRGIFGIERAYDSWIAGAKGRYSAARDGRGNVVGSRGAVMDDPTRGDDIVLTIDWGLQYAAEEALQSAVERSEAKGGVVVALDPVTGAVLAMASYPTFDLNNNNDPAFLTFQTNRAVGHAIEPGSVVKVVTAAAALHEGLVHEEEIIDCQGGLLTVPGGVIRDWKFGFGKLTLREVLMNSSNVGTAKVAVRMQPAQHHQWLLDFGFTSRTGVGLPGEVTGYLASPRIWSGRTQQTIAFGQEMSATPLQVVTALAAIANGGKLVRPSVIAAVRDRHGAVRSDRLLPDGTPAGSSVVRHRVLEPEIAQRVGLMMESVVAGGTGRTARIEGYRVAGKTSTAQKYDNEAGRYGGFVAGFGGFLPVSDPRIAIFVAIDEPVKGSRGGHGGSSSAGPVFKAVAEAAIRIMRLAPDEVVDASTMIADLNRETGERLSFP